MNGSTNEPIQYYTRAGPIPSGLVHGHIGLGSYNTTLIVPRPKYFYMSHAWAWLCTTPHYQPNPIQSN